MAKSKGLIIQYLFFNEQLFNYQLTICFAFSHLWHFFHFGVEAVAYDQWVGASPFHKEIHSRPDFSGCVAY